MVVNEWDLAQVIGKAHDWQSIPGITDFGLTIRQGANRSTPPEKKYAVMLIFGHKRLMNEYVTNGLSSISIDYNGKKWELPVYKKFVSKIEG